MIATPGYVVIVGDNWNWDVIDAWTQRHPGYPFVGLRVDGEEVWIACAPRTASCPLPTETLEAIQHVLEKAEDTPWIDENVYLCKVRNLREGLRLARLIVNILRNTGGSGPW